jgi:hypothetical protein
MGRSGGEHTSDGGGRLEGAGSVFGILRKKPKVRIAA